MAQAKLNSKDREVLREFARDILVTEGVWIREDAIRQLRLMGEIDLDEATRVIDEVYSELLRAMSPDKVSEAAEVAYNYLDHTTVLQSAGLVTATMVVEQVAGRACVSQAEAWAVVVGVQNAAGCRLDLKQSPYRQDISVGAVPVSMNA